LTKISISKLTELLKHIAFLVAYTLLSFSSMKWFSIDGITSVVYYPTGLSLATFILGGKRFWAMALLGDALGNYLIGSTLLLSFGFALGEVGEAFLGCWLLTKVLPFDSAMLRPRDFLYLLGSGITTCLIASLWGCDLLWLNGMIAVNHSFISSVLAWWQGDLLGIFLITPLILICNNRKLAFLKQNQTFELLVCFSLAILCGQVIFLGWMNDYLGNVIQDYWVFIFVVWTAVRFGKQSVLILINIVSIQALIGAIEGTGKFAPDLALTGMINYWIFTLIMTSIGLMLAQYVGQKKTSEQLLSELAHHDPLTGLPNRILFNDRFKHALELAKRKKQNFAVLILDLDGFKLVNDNHGHEAGDHLLKDAAKKMLSCVRATDTICRFGGDEFAVLLPLISQKDASQVAEKILDTLRRPFEINGIEFQITSSIGIALYPEHGKDEEGLIRSADEAMYHVKRNGKNSAAMPLDYN